MNAPVRVIQREAPAAAGAALIAAVALGHYPGFPEASDDWINHYLSAPEPVDQELRATYAGRRASPSAAAGGSLAARASA